MKNSIFHFPISLKVLFFGLIFMLSANFAQAQAFITTWGTYDGKIIIPTNPASGTYNYNIVWENITSTGVGNGSFTGATGNYTITGLTNGDTYRVSITGTFPHFFMNNHSTESTKIRSIEQWGSIAWTSMESAFNGCSNLTLIATDVPNLSGVTNMANMFARCSYFFGGNATMNTWNTSNVTDMSGMFKECKSFNQNIGGWNTSNVTDMSYMLSGARSFNQNIGNWNIRNVTQMSSMLDSCAMNIPNYDATLIAWAGKTLKPNVNLGAFLRQYCISVAARAILTSAPNNWIITGDEIVSCFSASPLTSNSLVQGETLKVAFTSSISFESGNIFTAQLSDLNGSFSAPINIGSLSLSGSKVSGIISAIIPENTPDGTKYRVRVTASKPSLIGGDNGKDIRIASSPLATEENDKGNLIIYPNPIKNLLYVSFGATPKTSVSAVMTDNLGRKMLDIEENVIDDKLEISTERLPTGIYFLTIRFDGTEKTIKIVKE